MMFTRRIIIVFIFCGLIIAAGAVCVIKCMKSPADSRLDVLKGEPADYGDRLRSAKALSWKGSLNESTEELNKIIRDSSKDDAAAESQARMELGRVLSWMKRYNEAKKQYKLAEEIEKEIVDDAAAEAHLKMRDTNKAEEYFRKAARRRPGNVMLEIWHARALCLNKRVKEAMDEYRAVLKEFPQNQEALLSCARAMAENGDYAGAIENYRDALNVNPEDCKARLGLAETLAWNGSMEESINEFGAVIGMKEKYSADIEIRARFGLGRVLSWMKKYDKAKEQYKEAQRLEAEVKNPKVEQALAIASGDRYFRKGKYAEAVASYKQALFSPAALSKIAGVYMEINETGRAVQYARDALKYAPDDARIRALYAAALSRDGRYKEAEGEYEVLLKENPRYIEALTGYAETLAMDKKHKKLLEVYRDIFKIYSGDEVIWLNYAQAVSWNGDSRGAVKLYNTIINKSAGEKNVKTEIAARIGLGEALILAGKIHDAEKQFQLALSVDGDNVGAVYGLGEVYELTNRPGEANKQYSKILQIEPGYIKAVEKLDSLRKYYNSTVFK
jgi:tetratricopeptide (TPR) repeat protein